MTINSKKQIWEERTILNIEFFGYQITISTKKKTEDILELSEVAQERLSAWQLWAKENNKNIDDIVIDNDGINFPKIGVKIWFEHFESIWFADFEWMKVECINSEINQSNSSKFNFNIFSNKKPKNIPRFHLEDLFKYFGNDSQPYIDILWLRNTSYSSDWSIRNSNSYWSARTGYNIDVLYLEGNVASMSMAMNCISHIWFQN